MKKDEPSEFKNYRKQSAHRQNCLNPFKDIAIVEQFTEGKFEVAQFLRSMMHPK